MDPTGVDQQLSDVAGLADPVRRALYRHVAGRDVAVTCDEAAQAVASVAADRCDATPATMGPTSPCWMTWLTGSVALRRSQRDAATPEPRVEHGPER